MEVADQNRASAGVMGEVENTTKNVRHPRKRWIIHAIISAPLNNSMDQKLLKTMIGFVLFLYSFAPDFKTGLTINVEMKIDMEKKIKTTV